jgi:predicted nucleic acid-binding protein
VIVVSDTTPLNYLVLIKAVEVLPKLFDQVYAPPSVIEELTRQKAPVAVRTWAQSPPVWLKIVAPTTRLASTNLLGDGEADALSLAKELHIRDVLIDERRGRNIAQREGLTPLPTLAVLERAATQYLLELRPALEKLQQTTIRVPRERIDAALRRDAARKRARQNSAE